MKASFSIVFLFGSYLLIGQASFPAAWVGNWKGTLEIFNATGKLQELPMQLNIQPLDSIPGGYTYEIVYGEDKITGTRPYELLTVDAAKGRYLLDEKNSIKMEAYFINGKLVQWFEVEGTLLFTTTELVGDLLFWEIIAGSSTPVSTTGMEIVDGEGVPPVKTFPVSAVQRAKLRRE